VTQQLPLNLKIKRSLPILSGFNLQIFDLEEKAQIFADQS
jgi:hypothetical protein